MPKPEQLGERLSRDQALERIRHHVRSHPPVAQTMPLGVTLGLVCAEELTAAQDAPMEARASMDGFALRSQDGRHATPEAPVFLAVQGEIRPSSAEQTPLAAGTAAAILTGGPLPPGANTVLPLEQAQIENQMLRLEAPLEPGLHVRPAGADVRQGSVILRKGEEMTPASMAALATAGVTDLSACLGPNCLVLAVGNELSMPGVPSAPGQITADNLLLATGLLRVRGALRVDGRTCRNAPEEIVRTFASCQDYDCVISAGGTGPGNRDFLPQSALDAGFTPLFHGLALHPGKSAFAAVKGKTLLFCLPGTPWAVFALMHALVLPTLCWLRGRTLPVPVPVLVRPAAPLPGTQNGWEQLVPCTLSSTRAVLAAQPLLDKSRETRLDMLDAQGLLIVGPTAEQEECLPMIPIWEHRRGHRP